MFPCSRRRAAIYIQQLYMRQFGIEGKITNPNLCYDQHMFPIANGNKTTKNGEGIMRILHLFLKVPKFLMNGRIHRKAVLCVPFDGNPWWYLWQCRVGEVAASKFFSPFEGCILIGTSRKSMPSSVRSITTSSDFGDSGFVGLACVMESHSCDDRWHLTTRMQARWNKLAHDVSA